MGLLRVPEGSLSSFNGMKCAVCATDLARPVDDAEHLRDRGGVSTQCATGFKVNASNLPRSLETCDAPECSALASVSIDWLFGLEPIVQNPHSAFLVTWVPPTAGSVRHAWD
jgi:hypothetical protein